MKKYILLILLCLSCVSCAPKTFEPFTPPEISWEQTLPYTNDVEMEKIKGLGKIKLIPVYVDKQSNKTTPDKATHVILTSNNYKDIGILIEKTKAYKMLAEEEEILINTYISIINSQKEYIQLERRKSIEYRQLWVMSENRFRQEEHRHTRDNNLNKISHYLIMIGSIALALTGL